MIRSAVQTESQPHGALAADSRLEPLEDCNYGEKESRNTDQILCRQIAAYPETMSGHERESLAAEATLAERRKPAKIKNKRKRREPSSHRFQYVPTTGRARDTS